MPVRRSVDEKALESRGYFSAERRADTQATGCPAQAPRLTRGLLVDAIWVFEVSGRLVAL